MIAVQITEIEFDFTTDGYVSPGLKRSPTDAYVGKIIELDLDNDATDDDISMELPDEVSDMSGWCVNKIDYRLVCS